MKTLEQKNREQLEKEFSVSFNPKLAAIVGSTLTAFSSTISAALEGYESVKVVELEALFDTIIPMITKEIQETLTK